MAIIQEKRNDAPRPETRETDYGAQYVTAGTETPIAPAAEESVESAEEVVTASEVESVVPAAPASPKKKGGRKKSRR